MTQIPAAGGSYSRDPDTGKLIPNTGARAPVTATEKPATTTQAKPKGGK